MGPSIVAEKNARKNFLDGRRTDRGKTVYPPNPWGSGGIMIDIDNQKLIPTQHILTI